MVSCGRYGGGGGVGPLSMTSNEEGCMKKHDKLSTVGGGGGRFEKCPKIT